MRKSLNILFVFLFTLILGLISFFNYIVDPYNIIIDRPPELHLYDYPKDLFSSVLKLSTRTNYDTVAFGGSTTDAFINYNLLPKNNAMLTSGYMISDTLQNYVKFFINNHPELKTVIFNIEYASYYFEKKDLFPEINSKNLTIKEAARLFLSIDSTILSIKKFKKDPQRILNKDRFKYRNVKNNLEQYPDSYELFNNNLSIEKDKALNIKYNIFIKRNNNHYMKGLYPNVLEHFDEYINLFESKNINVIYIFPAYHAMLQSKIYLDFDYKDIENIKRHFATKTKTKHKVIDFAYINKYTTEELNKTYLYVDLIHPYSYKYNFFYCVLSNLEKYRNKDVYVELTKDNIEDVLSEQRKRLEEYIEKNKTKINKFLSYNINNYNITKSSSEAPVCSMY